MAVGSYIGQVNIGANTHAIGSTLFGASNTIATEAAKVALLDGFNSLATGVTVHILFTTANTISTGVTLKVGSTEAKPITNPNGSLLWNANSIISFTYDGTTNWVINSAQIDTSNITIDMNQLKNLSLGNITNEGKINNSPNRIVVTDNNSLVTTGATLGSIADGTFLDNTGTFRSLLDTDVPGTIARLDSPDFTGTPTAPTVVDATDSSTNIATTAFVAAAINSKLAANDAMQFKGTISDPATIPSTHQAGDTYRITAAGNYAGYKCEVGDLLICTTDGTSANDSHWTVAQTNIDGSLFMGSNSLTSGELLIADGAAGKVKSSGFTIEAPSAGGILYGSSTNAYNVLAAGGAANANKVLTMNATGTAPEWADAQHYTSYLYVTSANGTNNTSTILSNNNVYLRLFENSTARSTHKISGAGATLVTTDASANIIITSTDTQFTSAGSANALTNLTLAYTANGTTNTETPSTATAVGVVENGILYMKSITYSTTSVSTGVVAVTT